MKTVFVSAGHSDSDPGAIGNGYKEATLAVKLRDRIAMSLRNKGISTLQDGNYGVNESLSRALQICAQADIAVEIHFNSAENPSATGVEALAPSSLRKFSQELCAAVSKNTGLKLRGSDGGWKLPNSGQHSQLGFCNAGGVVLEICFISNSSDINTYVYNKEAVAEAIANVLAKNAGWG